VFTVGGFHVPVIGGTLSELVGKTGAVAPWHKGANPANKGTILGLMVMVSFAIVAHKPDVGVNVYSVVELLFKAGLQVPVIPLFDVSGNAGIVFPSQTAGTGLKVGTVLVLTFTLLVTLVLAQPPAPGKVYSMIAKPPETPVMIPVDEITVATAGFCEVQLPPETLDPKVVVPPTQIVCPPFKIPGLNGAETVTFMVAAGLARTATGSVDNVTYDSSSCSNSCNDTSI